MAVHDPHDSYALASLGVADIGTSTLGRREHAINESFRFVQVPLLVKSLGQVHENFA